MEKSQAMQVKASQQSCNPILTLGGRVSQGTTLTVLAVAGVGSGLVLGWDSLVAPPACRGSCSPCCPARRCARSDCVRIAWDRRTR